MAIEIDRISPITVLLDDVFYQSSIQDMRSAYFQFLKHYAKWIIVSDYYLENEKANKVITFTVLPLAGDVIQLQNVIRRFAPQDFKHIKVVDPRFIELLQELPLMTISFVLPQDKYLVWSDSKEFREYLADFCETLIAYIAFWRKSTSNQVRLDKLLKNVEYAQRLLQQKKKIKLLCETFLIALLGGYVGSIICRETALTDLCWLSDRDKTNEVGNNLIRDLFQVTLIDIIKKNILFSFTTANSHSDEWYADLTRVPDIITGSIAAFNFDNASGRMWKPTAQTVIGSYLLNNRDSCFIYRFHVSEEMLKVQRLMVAYNHQA